MAGAAASAITAIIGTSVLDVIKGLLLKVGRIVIQDGESHAKDAKAQRGKSGLSVFAPLRLCVKFPLPLSLPSLQFFTILLDLGN
jgi:hypothetical protein